MSQEDEIKLGAKEHEKIIGKLSGRIALHYCPYFAKWSQMLPQPTVMRSKIET